MTVLEASTEYEDRVRGESMHAWGVNEARQLGVEPVLLDAGAHVAPRVEAVRRGRQPSPTDLPMSIMVPGVDGTLNLRHPDACQALVDAAAAAGATVVRGVRDVKLTPGHADVGRRTRVDDGTRRADRRPRRRRRRPGVDGAQADRRHPRDGRRRSATSPACCSTALDGVPDDYDVMVAEGDLVLPPVPPGRRPGPGLRGDRPVGPAPLRRAGSRPRTFLAAYELDTYPWSDQVRRRRPPGRAPPIPGDDTWTATPYADGVVLIGDAAGHNDPIIGEGLSIAMRDARTVRDLVLDGARKPADFAPYGEERVERMRRLRLDRRRHRGRRWSRTVRQPGRPARLARRADGDDGPRALPAPGRRVRRAGERPRRAGRRAHPRPHPLRLIRTGARAHHHLLWVMRVGGFRRTIARWPRDG